MSATLTPSRQDVALSTLLEEFTHIETRRLVHSAIARVLSQGHRLDECRAEANDVANVAASYEHIKPAPCIDTHGCSACFHEADYERVLAVVDRQRLLLMGKAVAA